MDSSRKDSWTLAELAEETGLSPRTIRYYIARGLLDGPVVAGRRATYTAAQLERLRSIKELQARGKTLAEIGHKLHGAVGREELPSPVAWQSYALADDVVVWVRADGSPWRTRQLRESLREFAARLERTGGKEDASDTE